MFLWQWNPFIFISPSKLLLTTLLLNVSNSPTTALNGAISTYLCEFIPGWRDYTDLCLSETTLKADNEQEECLTSPSRPAVSAALFKCHHRTVHLGDPLNIHFTLFLHSKSNHNKLRLLMRFSIVLFSDIDNKLARECYMAALLITHHANEFISNDLLPCDHMTRSVWRFFPSWSWLLLLFAIYSLLHKKKKRKQRKIKLGMK